MTKEQCPCACCAEGRERLRTGRSLLKACGCAGYEEDEQCDCLFCRKSLDPFLKLPREAYGHGSYNPDALLTCETCGESHLGLIREGGRRVCDSCWPVVAQGETPAVQPCSGDYGHCEAHGYH